MPPGWFLWNIYVKSNCVPFCRQVSGTFFNKIHFPGECVCISIWATCPAWTAVSERGVMVGGSDCWKASQRREAALLSKHLSQLIVLMAKLGAWQLRQRPHSGDPVLPNQGNKVPHAAHCLGSFKVDCRHTHTRAQTLTHLSVDAEWGEESRDCGWKITHHKKHTEEFWDVSLGGEVNFCQVS